MDIHRPPVIDYKRLKRITSLPDDSGSVNAATYMCISLMALGAIVLFKRYQDKLHRSPKNANTLWL